MKHLRKIYVFLRDKKYFYRIGRIKFIYMKLLQSQYFSKKELERLQLASLNNLINHARSSKYYRALYSESKIDSELNSCEKIKSLPIVSKMDYILSSDSFLTNSKSKGLYMFRVAAQVIQQKLKYLLLRNYSEGPSVIDILIGGG